MRDNITFLTSKPLDKKRLLEIIKKFKIENGEDYRILEKIIHDFSKNDFTLINSQENFFLNLHPQELWAPY